MFSWLSVSVCAGTFELNLSADTYRGLPEGSWNGNSGIFLSGNYGTSVCNLFGFQVGGSLGFYNWYGRENLVFKNPQATEQQAFFTTGLFSSLGQWNVGVVYDGQYANHFGIYDRSVSVDQLRYQGGYVFCQEEVGFWGTLQLSTAHRTALGVPLSFRAISQLSAFWTHYFDNLGTTTFWVGAPYTNSLRFPHHTAGTWVAGFALRAPLCDCFVVDAHGSYMGARCVAKSVQSRNYASNVCVGITYIYGDRGCYSATYMPLANNSNFLVDTNRNQ